MRISLELHKQAKKEAYKIYKLPYRVYYDYLRKRAFAPTNRLMLNPCYPEPGYPIDGIIQVLENDFEIPQELLNGSRDNLYVYQYLKPEIKTQVDAIKRRFCSWDSPDVFNEKWKSIFLKYLNGYDIESFSCFDFFGATLNELDDPELGLIDESQIEMIRAVYLRLQGEYMENPSKYEYKEPYDAEEYSYLYTDCPFALKFSKEEALAKIDMYKRMNMPMSEVEQEAFFKMHGVES